MKQNLFLCLCLFLSVLVIQAPSSTDAVLKILDIIGADNFQVVVYVVMLLLRGWTAARPICYDIQSCM